MISSETGRENESFTEVFCPWLRIADFLSSNGLFMYWNGHEKSIQHVLISAELKIRNL